MEQIVIAIIIIALGFYVFKFYVNVFNLKGYALSELPASVLSNFL